MRMRNWIVSEEDFGDDVIYYYSCSCLSPLDCLAIVAQKKETALSSTLFLHIPMVERHKPIKKKLFECQATEVEQITMVEQQFTSSGNPKIWRSKLPKIEKTTPKPNIPFTMVEVEETRIIPTKRNKEPSTAQSPILPQEFKDVIFFQWEELTLSW
ncbi:hypothetical protein Cgig2_009077 [Carnegiea gigantea]|uniref:Uncharacterized protein n=1 Tax=Carnegiea gigantea TaxID=171969 RepID=A0A9Q1KED7_9CARY|nr:hypothetical protein Cgig2_009077 [Carnegiea gigantea]